ncbi:glycosyltransferase family 2 protein [Actinopolymorpha singaporensis]|uniref:Glycosyltransferase 2-like domain-containing protein n=1 Tax=Actinopolymorpha singaporensis TaxID=117157 RepID=A0A1H1UTU9_9ACTN|nr:glycosyltransferase family 2 protein [Actinopolymorpha singaporensis]SDS75903.1 hypothetical protein SAMN04489717_3772 [Actinopolymorpha singaporensis]
MSERRVDVVVVNWNSGDCLRACIDSLAGPTGRGQVGDVVVVDNASTDGSAEGLPNWVKLVANPGNIGFAAACNQGADHCASDYLLFLNPDTVVSDDTIQRAAAFLDSRENLVYGICGALAVNRDGSPGLCASRFPTLTNVMAGVLRLDRVVRRWARHLPPEALRRGGPVDQVIGAFFVIRRALFGRLGGFDERYFLYYEEVDLSKRAKLLGFGSYLIVDATFEHIGNVSAKRSGDLALYHSLRSRSLYAFQHWPAWQAYLLIFFTLAVDLPARLLRAVVAKELGDLPRLVRASNSYLRFVLGLDRSAGTS